jgi:5-hydroxyisourate hydrolase
MSGISTHILDTSLGKPAAGIPVILERADSQHWLTCASTISDSDGRCSELLCPEKAIAGRYRLTFATAAYFAAQSRPALYPEISILFDVTADNTHIPLLLSPYGYTTYRGT